MSWTDYYEATSNRPPRPTLLRALQGFVAPGFAIDLGCGDGRDTIELLGRGWSVLAIDAEPAALERLASRPDLPPKARLETRCTRFEDTSLPPADLINASFCLPLCPPERFPDLWTRIRSSLEPSGRFAGQLYGDRDGWAGRPDITCLTRPEVEALLEGWHTELFEEEETEGMTPRGKPKRWHIFHVVAGRSD